MLAVNNISIKFGGLVAVNDVSFVVNKNTIYGIIGPNGAGKTTLFNIISGVYKPLNGKILFKDNEIQGLKPYKINKLGIARTYQNINLFKNMTVLDNVMSGLHTMLKSGLLQSIVRSKSQRSEEKSARNKSMEILKFVNLCDEANHLAKSLPYGQQRLLEIARALATSPDLLLLDEPAAGMNTKEKADLMDLIRKIKNIGITILIVEHDMKLVMGISDSICVLNYGKKIAEGEPKYIQNNPGVIEAYLGGDKIG